MSDLSEYIVDEFVATRTGKAYRILPFGKISKGGKTRDITPEYAAKFRLPHFKPPIKLGSHKEETPAGGHILSLEVRDDGLYVLPELNEKGEMAFLEGAYRYHSPEIIWENGGIENNDGVMYGPLIIGDALLHVPHLGESTSFYSADKIDKGVTMSEENTVNVPATVWEKLTALFDRAEKFEAKPVNESLVDVETFEATVKERDEYRAKIEAYEAEKKHAELVEKLGAELKSEVFGSVFSEGAGDAAEMLSGMTEDQREWILKTVKGLAAQVDATKLTSEIGSDGEGIENPVEAFNAAVLKIKNEKKINYNDALAIARVENKELFEAYTKGA